MSNAIRLTNKTAIGLRKNAVRLKKTYFACTVVLSIVMGVLAVYLGLKRLIAVPVVVVIAVLLDTLIIIRGRSVYLMMIGQAICTEAAAREIRLGTSETRRREKAITDLISAKADMEMAQKERKDAVRSGKMPVRQSMHGEKDSILKAEPIKEEENGEETAMRRRRRSEGLKLIRGEQAK